MARLIVAGVILFGMLVSARHLPDLRRKALLLEATRQRAAIELPYDIVAMMIIITAFVVGVFYCLDALHGERRDRSILFWKSLPVSDLTAVLSKASIPLVVLPILCFVIIVVTQLVMLLLNAAALMMSGVEVSTLWTQWPMLQNSLALVYALIAIALWHASIYAWLLLVSAWARRTPFLWAVLPLIVISVFEKIAFSTSHFASMLQYRAVGWFTQGFVMHAPGIAANDPLAHLTPGKFVATPGLWIGLAFAAAFLAAAVRLRR